jgi:hypothetical protein
MAGTSSTCWPKTSFQSAVLWGHNLAQLEPGTCIIVMAVSFGGSSFGHSSSNRPPPTTFSAASP